MSKKKIWLKKYFLIISKLIKIDFEYDSVRKKLIHANDTNIILYGYGILISVNCFCLNLAWFINQSKRMIGNAEPVTYRVL